MPFVVLGRRIFRILADKYLSRETTFYFEKLSDGRDRFAGRTFADKLNAFFGGFPSNGKPCRYVHDFESLSCLFEEAGFFDIHEKAYRESRIPGVEKIDNRPEQMFFLEASKPDRNTEVEVKASAQLPARCHPVAEPTHHDARLPTAKGSQSGSFEEFRTSYAEHGDDQLGLNPNTKISQLDTLIHRILRTAQRPAIDRKADMSELPSGSDLADTGFLLWTKGLQDQAWQCFLKTLDEDPVNKRVTLKCGRDSYCPRSPRECRKALLELSQPPPLGLGCEARSG